MNKVVLLGLSMAVGMVAGASAVGIKMNDLVEQKDRNSEKYRMMYQMMEHWMRVKQRGGSLDQYFESYGYKNIAIYGMAEIGKLLVEELKDTAVEVKYGIDKNENATDMFKIYSPVEILPKVDAIVVTAIAYYDEIEKILSEKNDIPIISLEDIVYEVV